MDCEVVDPTAHSVKARQDGPDDLILEASHEEQLGLHRHLATNHLCRIIPGRVIRKYDVPEHHDTGVVLVREGPNFYDLF
jgi:hypothetical protein